MRKYSLIGLGSFLLLLAIAISGCGAGGAGVAAVSPAGSTTIISGLASKGPIKTGTVKVYAIRNGAEDRAAPLGQGETDTNGNYSIDVGPYKGQVMVEVSGGSFTDEVTGAAVTLKAPLRAIFADASSGKKTVAITPLTELAYKKAQGAGAYTDASINDANANIAAMFKLADIISTLPVAGGASDDQKKYAAACGSFSQYVNDNKNAGESLDDALSRLLTQIGDESKNNGIFSYDTIIKINNAIAGFNTNGKNQTGATMTPIPLPTSGLLKLSTAGIANTIGAIDVAINLPVGVRVNANATTGETAAGVITISGVAASGDNKMATAKFTPASAGTQAQLHIFLIHAAGFGLGEFVTIKFDLDTGGNFPPTKNAFDMAGFAAKGLNGSPISGVTAAPSSMSVAF